MRGVYRVHFVATQHCDGVDLKVEMNIRGKEKS